MSITIKTAFDWLEAYSRSSLITDVESDQAKLARNTLEQSVRSAFLDFCDLTYNIDGTDEEHILVNLSDERSAMLFRLRYGGELA